MLSNVCRVLTAACLAGFFAGCESSDFEVAKVSGTVTCGGEPVMLGTVIFTPVATGELVGKPAVGKIQPDGTFTLTTYQPDDGAVVGEHRVRYSAPEEFEEEELPADEFSDEAREQAARRVAKANAMRKLASCGLAEELILDVAAGQENNFTIELTPGAGETGEEEEEPAEFDE